jgi:ornithine carbamoyltransferase
MNPANVAVLLANARSLQHAAQAGNTPPLLRGKKLGLLCDADKDADAVLFRSAAVALGAHVAHIKPSLSERSTPQEVEDTARILGRLYDAIECQGMAAALVAQVGDGAGVPVYDGIASAAHPTARLVDQLDAPGALEDKRRYVLQAVLLSTLA